MVRTKFTARKSCIRPREFKLIRPPRETEILPTKPETSSEESQEPFQDPEEIPEEDPEENAEEDPKGNHGKDPSKGSCKKNNNKKAAIPLDPAIQSDAESEYRPMNSIQERLYSPANSGESRESRVGPKRRRVS